MLTTPIRERIIDHGTANREMLKPMLEIAAGFGINAHERTITKVFAKDGYFQHAE
ncbi:hypothetical protein K469DRAFT_714725 [Zopfia rhizophila CBS 207.26]|uniref:Uncharacterized protein n=1 Tax=Zopfia rhizophila CBS 207.26 TaxID=1314779 RepID=A0A6A6DRS6_9PEZI|nr:hypothetical protein K469DRAFT_714725 [Zopfia rhizophila CBS 207.26]